MRYLWPTLYLTFLGITELQCQLKGCCYSNETGECSYPDNQLSGLFGQSLGVPINLNVQEEFYPELVAETVEETQCSQVRLLFQSF